MINTEALLFSDPQQQSIVNKQKAELYMQIYQYAAEDFFTTADMYVFHLQLTQYCISLEAQLTRLASTLATHTHIAPMGGTSPPTNNSSIIWNDLSKPSLKFTSGVEPNLYGNKVTIGTALAGSPSLGLRRIIPLKTLSNVTLPPVMIATTKGLL